MTPLHRSVSPSPPLDGARIAHLSALYAARWSRSPEGIACREFDGAAQAWQQWTWDMLARRAARYAAGLQNAGLRRGDRVAVRLPNGVDWLAIDWAAQALGLVTVGLLPEETPAVTAELLEDSGARLLFVPDVRAWALLKPDLHAAELRSVVLLNGTTARPERHARMTVQSLSGWLPDSGVLPETEAQPDDLAALIYTSGATGTPKGVMLSHVNLLSNTFACLRALELRPDDTVYSLLPLAHAFGRTAFGYLGIAAGTTLLFGRGASQLPDDMRSQGPSILVGVPRLFERIHGALLAEVDEAPPTRRALFRLAIETGWAAQRKGTHPLKVRLLPTGLARRVGNDLRDRLGGKLRLAVSGGAGLSPEIARTFMALGIPLLQGYGLTEAGPVVSVDRLENWDTASAGRLLDTVERRVSASGELQIRGPGVMLGYWRDETGTRAVLDDAGWLSTGDKVSRLETERLFLTGRAKEILVTAAGEKVSPALIEQRLAELPLVDQVMVVGEARPFLAALIVPRAEALALLRGHLGVNDGDDTPAARARIEAHVLEQCQELLAAAPRHHRIVSVALLDQGWTVANGLLTATQKLRRCQILRQHAADIARAYAGHYLAPPTDCASNADT
jgi:long-chain acyl-CoA synthetase